MSTGTIGLPKESADRCLGLEKIANGLDDFLNEKRFALYFVEADCFRQELRSQEHTELAVVEFGH